MYVPPCMSGQSGHHTRLVSPRHVRGVYDMSQYHQYAAVLRPTHQVRGPFVGSRCNQRPQLDRSEVGKRDQAKCSTQDYDSSMDRSRISSSDGFTASRVATTDSSVGSMRQTGFRSPDIATEVWGGSILRENNQTCYPSSPELSFVPSGTATRPPDRRRGTPNRAYPSSPPKSMMGHHVPMGGMMCPPPGWGPLMFQYPMVPSTSYQHSYVPPPLRMQAMVVMPPYGLYPDGMMGWEMSYPACPPTHPSPCRPPEHGRPTSSRPSDVPTRSRPDAPRLAQPRRSRPSAPQPFDPQNASPPRSLSRPQLTPSRTSDPPIPSDAANVSTTRCAPLQTPSYIPQVPSGFATQRGQRHNKPDDLPPRKRSPVEPIFSPVLPSPREATKVDVTPCLPFKIPALNLSNVDPSEPRGVLETSRRPSSSVEDTGGRESDDIRLPIPTTTSYSESDDDPQSIDNNFSENVKSSAPPPNLPMLALGRVSPVDCSLNAPRGQKDEVLEDDGEGPMQSYEVARQWWDGAKTIDPPAEPPQTERYRPRGVDIPESPRVGCETERRTVENRQAKKKNPAPHGRRGVEVWGGPDVPPLLSFVPPGMEPNPWGWVDAYPDVGGMPAGMYGPPQRFDEPPPPLLADPRKYLPTDLPQWSMLSPEDLTFGAVFSNPFEPMAFDKINSGTFCTIFRGAYKGQVVAIKCAEKHQLAVDSYMALHRAYQEWRILSRAMHPNVLRLTGGVVHKAEVWLVTELVPGGDLYTLLHHRAPLYLRPTARLRMMKQLSSAMAYLHGLHPKIVHKDMKSNNVLVDGDLNVKICDFGDAEMMYGEYLQCYTAATWQYAPPEIIAASDPSRPEKATEKVDIWALGCVFLEICLRPTPFKRLLSNVDDAHQREVLRQLLLSGNLEAEKRIDGLPDGLFALISQCLQLDSTQRPSATQVHEFIETHWDRLIGEMELVQAALEAHQRR